MECCNFITAGLYFSSNFLFPHIPDHLCWGCFQVPHTSPPPQPLTSPLPIGAGVGVGCWVVGICQPCGWFSVLGSLLVTVEVPGYPDTHLFLIVEAAVNLWESSVNLSFRLYLVHDTYDCQLGFYV